MTVLGIIHFTRIFKTTVYGTDLSTLRLFCITKALAM